ncbi:hypothetical protein JTL87_32565, partial [Pseudomonas aeruginosa]|nr:hypothetical protein [Pseudomonas aeruginosa]
KQQKRVKPFKNRCFYDSDARFSELICKIDKFARLSDFVQRFLKKTIATRNSDPKNNCLK